MSDRKIIPLLDGASIDRDLMDTILDVHSLLVKRRQSEGGEKREEETILFAAIQRYGGDATEKFEVVPKIAEEVKA